MKTLVEEFVEANSVYINETLSDSSELQDAFSELFASLSILEKNSGITFSDEERQAAVNIVSTEVKQLENETLELEQKRNEAIAALKALENTITSFSAPVDPYKDVYVVEFKFDAFDSQKITEEIIIPLSKITNDLNPIAENQRYFFKRVGTTADIRLYILIYEIELNDVYEKYFMQYLSHVDADKYDLKIYPFSTNSWPLEGSLDMNKLYFGMYVDNLYEYNVGKSMSTFPVKTIVINTLKFKAFYLTEEPYRSQIKVIEDIYAKLFTPKFITDLTQYKLLSKEEYAVILNEQLVANQKGSAKSNTGPQPAQTPTSVDDIDTTIVPAPDKNIDPKAMKHNETDDIFDIKSAISEDDIKALDSIAPTEELTDEDFDFDI